MQLITSRPVLLVMLATCLAVAVAACGDDDDALAEGAATPAAPSAAPAPAVPDEMNLPKPTPSAAPPSAPSGEDPEKECRIQAVCERKCRSECAAEERDRTAYYNAKRARVESSPFQVEVERVYMRGSCHSGDTPEKRRDASGIAVVVEGQMTYNGDDVLYQAEPKGSMYVRVGSAFHEMYTAERSYSYYGRGKPVSRFTRSVRGVDPWVKGQSRFFHWETKSLDPVYCEIKPDQAEAYIEISTLGVAGGRVRFPTYFVPLPWDEVVGMALRQQVKVLKKVKKEYVREPADALFSKLDRILVTRLTGKSEWLKRSQVVQTGDLGRGPAAVFPVEASTSDWKIKVTGVSNAEEYGGYAPKGEDQFLAVVDIELAYNPVAVEEPTPTSLKGLSLRLETSPGRWQRTTAKAMGQLDTAVEVEPGGSVSGQVVFPRQRFERPFRLEVKTPDKAVSTLDVFTYDLGPERAK